MAKSKLRNPFIIVLVIALIGVAAWYFLSNTVNKKAEEQLQLFLTENNLQDQVKWESLEASPTGSARLKKVSFIDTKGALFMTAEELHLKHFKQDEKLLETEAEIKGLVDVSGGAFQEQLNELYQLVGVESPNYIDLLWQINLDNTQQKSVMSSHILLPALFIVETELITDNPEKIRELSKVVNSTAGFEEPGEEEILALFDMMSDIKIQHLTFGLVEKGGVEKLRHQFVKTELQTGTEALEPEQEEELLAQEIATARKECLVNSELRVILKDQERACNDIFDFVSGTQDAIKFKASLAKPVAFDEILMLSLMMGASPEVMVKEYGLSVEVE